LFVPDSYKFKYCSVECRKKYASGTRHDIERFDGNRKIVLKRDGYKCVDCGSRYKVQVHHKDFSGQSENPNNDPDNLISLCERCHQGKHKTLGYKVNCMICGKEFYTTSYKQSIGKGKYCSPECSQKAQTGTHKHKPITKQIATKCLQCGKEFPTTQDRLDDGRGKYCSKDCLHEALKTMPSMKKKERKSLVKVNCQVCGKEFDTVISNVERGKAKYCSRPCYYKSRIKT
jgi:hypothetical protein